ncbi:MAG: apolipoprotein N-acyltransferase [Vulcanimicrobiaceae bacterium]
MLQRRDIAIALTTAVCGALCGALLGFPWAARIAVAAPLTMLPLFYAYQSGRRAACVWLTVLFAIAEFLAGLHWVYASAAMHRGPGEYWISGIALLLACIPYVFLGFAAASFCDLAPPLWCFAIASLWTLCEYWRATWLFGIPYGQLGHALIDTPFVGMARIGGTDVLTFACVLGAAVVFQLWRCAPNARVVVIVLCAFFLASNVAAFITPKPLAEPGDSVTVFQLGENDDIALARYIDALRTLPPVPGFVVWPESGVNLTRGKALTLVRSAVHARRIPLLAGGTIEGASGHHDAIVYFDRDGTVKGTYAKRHLVPFGEFLPFPKLFHVLIPRTILDGISNLAPGAEPVTFTVGDRRVGPLVCFESAFPSLARDEVRMGANLLVSATNDAWFTQSPELWQLGQVSRLVALETGTPMLLAGTVGPTGMIDADGRPAGSVPVDTSVRAIFSAPPARETVYDTLGDGPSLLLLGALVAFANAARVRYSMDPRLRARPAARGCGTGRLPQRVRHE